MQNVDVGTYFHNWFLFGFVLSSTAALCQLLAVYAISRQDQQQRWITTLYLLLDFVIVLCTILWITYGAFWRFGEFGELCSSDNYLQKQGAGLLLFY